MKSAGVLRGDGRWRIIPCSNGNLLSEPQGSVGGPGPEPGAFPFFAELRAFPRSTQREWTMPPRHPNDDENDEPEIEEEDDEDRKDDDPAVIREPDEED